jgi:DNA-binding SARP family transcriptional activator
VAEQPVPIVLRVQLLGGFRVWVGEARIAPEAWRPKAAALVKLLALSPQHSCHREELLEQLWPRLSEKAALNNLHQVLYQLRQTLPAVGNRLSFQGERLHLCPGGRMQVDICAFAQQASLARQSREVRDFETAVSLYRGDLLPEDRYEDWAAIKREELCELYLSLELDLAMLYKAQGDHQAARACLQRAIAKDPALEAAYLALMRLHVETGEPQQATALYERLRRFLRRSLRITPSRTLEALYLSLLDAPDDPAP